jgi:hypothetical protein
MSTRPRARAVPETKGKTLEEIEAMWSSGGTTAAAAIAAPKARDEGGSQ